MGLEADRADLRTIREPAGGYRVQIDHVFRAASIARVPSWTRGRASPHQAMSYAGGSTTTRPMWRVPRALLPSLTLILSAGTEGDVIDRERFAP
jgi:hypothetical protein